MKVFGVFFAAALCIAGSVAEIEVEDGILIITDDNFKEAVQEHTYLAIEFYAPWCGACKQFAPKYIEIAEALKDHSPEIKVGKADATVETSLAQENEIRSFPTLRFFRDGVPINYGGDLEVRDVINWLVKKAAPPAEELRSIRGAKRFIKNNEIAILGFFRNFDSNDAEVFWKVANSLGDYEFGITKTESVFKEFKVNDGEVALFKKFDEGQVVYKKKMDMEKLVEFIESNSLPLVIDFDEKSAAKIFGGKVKDFLFAFLSEDDGHFDEYADYFTKTAKKFRGKLTVVTLNVDEASAGQMLEFFGLETEDVPVMRIVKLLDSGIHKYQPENPELTEDSIYSFASKYMKGDLKRYLAAEEVPEDWNAKPVKVLTGKNFEKIALDKSKHVLVEFYAPWCGHCKELAPIYDELGEKYKNNKNVVISKIDATANELEDVEVQGYPTLILFKKGTNEAIHFDGNRTLEGMSKFIDSDGVEGAREKEEEDDRRKDEL